MPNPALSQKEQDLIVATVSFANLKFIDSNRQVEDLFGLQAGRIDEDSTLYRDETQPMLRRWLAQVAGGNCGRAQVSLQVAQLMPRTIAAVPVYEAGHLSYDFELPCVDAACILAVALILDESRGLTGRLQQCTLSWCGKFGVDFDGHARPRPRKYCSANHRMLANYEQSPERMRQWRKAA